MASAVAQARAARGSYWLAWLVLAAAWFATSPVRPLLDPDEGRYAEIPREMLTSGDWLTPRFDGLKYFEKPPLQYWATASVYTVAGVSEWSSRLWSVGLAFGCLVLTFLWSGALYGRVAGLAALAALAVSPYFVLIGHLNLLDAGFTFWLTAAVFAFTRAQCAPAASGSERRWMLAAWAAAALAVLSKGIVVGVLAGGALIIYSLLERDARPWRRLHVLPGLALFLALAAPWFVAVSLRNPGFATFFFVHEHFARFLTTVHQRVEPWWYFLPLLVVGALPWLVPLARAVAPAWREEPGADAGAGAPAAAAFKPRRFLLIFAAVTLAFFSASGSKLAPYILPMFPALAAVVGSRTADLGRLARGAAWVGAGLTLLIAVAGVIYSARRNNFVPAEALVWIGAAALLATVAVVMTLRRLGLAPQRAAAAVALAAVLSWQCLLCAYAIIPPARSARDLVAQVRPAIGRETRLYSVGQYRETVSPYLGRTLTLVDYQGELAFGLAAEPGRQSLSNAAFQLAWGASGDAVAFFDPNIWDAWRRQGFPGRVIAADNYTVAVSRL